MLRMRKLLIFAVAALLASPASAAILMFDFAARVDRPNSFFAVGTILNGSFSYDSELARTVIYNYPGTSGGEYHDPSIRLGFNALGQSYEDEAFGAMANNADYEDYFTIGYIGTDYSYGVHITDPIGTSFSGHTLPASFPALYQGPPLEESEDDNYEEDNQPTIASGEFSFYDVKNRDMFEATILNISPTAVPEPGAWAMMIVGFMVIGAALRMNRQVSLSPKGKVYSAATRSPFAPASSGLRYIPV